jgi:hypothetical protein
VPLTAATDRQALYLALACCLKIVPEASRIARIADTKHVEELWASEPLVPELLASGRVDQVGGFEPIRFDADGMFATEVAHTAVAAD